MALSNGNGFLAMQDSERFDRASSKLLCKSIQGALLLLKIMIAGSFE